MKVFVSSVIGSMQEMRAAAKDAIAVLGHEALMAEDFPARPETPQQACLAGVREADAVVLLLGSRYGDLQAGGISATHEEYREARERKPILVFEQQGVEREEAQLQFVREVQSWSAGQFTRPFKSPDELSAAITRALHDFQLGLAAGAVDVAALLLESERLIPKESDVRTTSLCISVAGGPMQQVLRPADIENASLSDRLMRDAMFGSNPIFAKGGETKAEIEGNELRLRQDLASLRLTGVGSVAVAIPAIADSMRNAFALVEEDIQVGLGRALAAIADILDSVDSVVRLTDVVITAAIIDGSYKGWVTRAEVERNQGSWPTSSAGGRVAVQLAPPDRKRAALRHDADRIVEDLMVLLRRSFS